MTGRLFGNTHTLCESGVASIKLDPTKAVLIYRRTGNLRAVQLLLGDSKIESAVRYLAIQVAEMIDI